MTVGVLLWGIAAHNCARGTWLSRYLACLQISRWSGSLRSENIILSYKMLQDSSTALRCRGCCFRLTGRQPAAPKTRPRFLLASCPNAGGASPGQTSTPGPMPPEASKMQLGLRHSQQDHQQIFLRETPHLT